MRGLFKSRSSKESESLKNDSVWLLLATEEQFDELIGSNEPFFIFKHSPRCSISVVAKSRIDKQAVSNTVPVYLIDVVMQRELSQHIARHLEVEHQSPQLLKIENGKCVFNASHLSISPSQLL